MHRKVFIGLLFCVFLASGSSLQCYTGTDAQCMLSNDMKDCGSDSACQCVKYRFKCTEDDQACTDEERSKGITKWAYTIVPKTTCEMMKSTKNIYSRVKCCSKNKCNKPNSGKCTWH